MSVPPDDPTWSRLEDQIGWYDKSSARSQRIYKCLKFTTIAAAAVIPLAAGLGAPAWVTGGLG